MSWQQSWSSSVCKPQKGQCRTTLRLLRAGGSTYLVIETVLRAEGTNQLLGLAKVVAWQRGEQVVLDLAVQAAGEPVRDAIIWVALMKTRVGGNAPVVEQVAVNIAC